MNARPFCNYFTKFILFVFMVVSFALFGAPSSTLTASAAEAAQDTQTYSGWFNNSGTWYYYDNSDTPATGWLLLGDTYYYLDERGAMQTGWIHVGSSWYYMNKSGAMQTGWVQYGGSWYYLNSWGSMRTGWLNIGGIYYFFDQSGAMHTGWLKDGDTWYYFDSWGSMRTGWLNMGGTYYYFNASGSMKTGWFLDEDTWYYFDSWGPMRTGWLKAGNHYFYFNKSGSMQTGWLTIGDTTYYLAASGAMVTGAYTIEGKTYRFSSTGALQEGKLVVLDPGHSSVIPKGTVPIGPGASTQKASDSIGTRGVTTRVYEYALTLQIAFKLQSELEDRGYTVLLTRTDSSTAHGCIERANVANDNNADCFVRLHANGSSNQSANGAMTICITENNPYISSMYQKSKLLSEKLLDSYVAATGCKKEYVWETDTMTGNNWSKVPTTLIEFGYMTNSAEDVKMQDAGYQEKMVQGIANGIDAYFDAID